MSDHRPTTYRDAGVDIDAGDELVERIKPAVKRSMRPEVLGGLGGFGTLVEVPGGEAPDPVLGELHLLDAAGNFVVGAASSLLDMFDGATARAAGRAAA